MQTLGAKLRSTRESKGITLEEAHKKTKLSINVIRALEEDDLSSFSPIYAKGFLKIYAKFLGIEPSNLLQEYNKVFTKQQNIAEVKKEQYVHNKESISIKKRSLDLRLKLFHISPKVKIYLVRIILAFILVFFIILGINFLKNIFSKVSKTLTTKKQTVVKIKEEAIKETAKPKSSSLKSTNQEEKKQNTHLRSEASSLVRIGLKARKDTWVQIKVDGKNVFQGTLRKGSVESWQAKNKIILSVHNANDIDLDFQDKQLYPLSHKKQAMKNIVFTKEGMSTQ